MKKYLALLLLLIPILVGCMNQEPDQSQSTTLPTITLPPAYYEENSKIEQMTAGAVKKYDLPENGYSGIFRVGNNILLAADGEKMQLQMLIGETCVPGASTQLDRDCLEQCVSLSNGFAYYDKQEHSIVYLDPNLNQKHSVALTADMTTPILSPDGSLIFYCVGQDIRVLDVEKNISRLVKTQTADSLALVDTCFDGNVLICEMEGQTGTKEIYYISAKDGQTLRKENGIENLYTYDDRFLTLWLDGSVRQWVCGTQAGAASRFSIEDEKIFDAMNLGGVVGCSATENALVLNFYEIPEAKRTATLTLQGIGKPEALLADSWTNCLWIISEDAESKEKVLLKWDMEKSNCTDEKEYTEVLYTAANPDEEAIRVLQSRVDELNAKHGVRIRIWQEAVSVPGEHTLVPEHHAEAITAMVDQLEAVLQEFPKGFVSKSISSRVRICLVRSVDGMTKGKQYWDGRYAFIALCSGSDIREEFLKGFGLVVDSHVLGNSPIYDYWDTLNPAGFQYGKEDETYMTGDVRYFVDVESMTSAMFDRSRVFWQAMKPDNAELFKGEIMQKKLTMLCEAIRDAWRLEKKSEVYPWEQYLEESIAYKKK